MSKSIRQVTEEINTLVSAINQDLQVSTPSELLSRIGLFGFYPPPVFQSVVYVQNEAERYLYDLKQLSGENLDKLKELIENKAASSSLSIVEAAEFCFRYYREKGKLPEVKPDRL